MQVLHTQNAREIYIYDNISLSKCPVKIITIVLLNFNVS